MAIDLVSILAYEGPHIFGPQAGLLVRLRCDRDYSRRLKDALKDGAQYIGLVIGSLDVSCVQEDARWLVQATFITPMPAIAATLAEYVVEGLRVEEARAGRDDDEDEEEWDRDTPLYSLQRQRRAEAPTLPLLQLEAEARTRDLPVVRRLDGAIQLGYGARSWTVEASALASGQPPSPPWDQIGRVPIIAVVGDSGRSVAISQLDAALRTAGEQWSVTDGTLFADTQACLTDAQTQQALIGLALDGIATQGLAFDRCTRSAIIDTGTTRPPALLNDEEWAHALGVPMLVTEASGFCVLNADEPLIAPLAAYAPCAIVFISASDTNEVVAQHRSRGGAALFARDGLLVAAEGTQEQTLEPAPMFYGNQLAGALAARALLHAWQRR